MSDQVTKFDIPVTYNFDSQKVIGRGPIQQDGDGSLITIKTSKDFPLDFLEGIVEMSFFVVPCYKKGNINEEKSNIESH